MKSGDLHIASCLVAVVPGALADVVSAIATCGLGEVFQTDPRGRIVVVLEGAASAAILDAMDAIREMPGVMNVNLVYQHCESATALAEEIA